MSSSNARAAAFASASTASLGQTDIRLSSPLTGTTGALFGSNAVKIVPPATRATTRVSVDENDVSDENDYMRDARLQNGISAH